MRCCTENHVFVVFEHPEPVPDMGGVIFPDLRRDAEVGAAKGCSQFHPFGAPVAGLRRRRDLLVLTQKVGREYERVISRERRGMIRDSPAERTPRVLTNCRTYPIARDSPQPVFASSERTCREALTAAVASCLARLLRAAPTQPPAGRSNGPAPWSSQPDHTSRLSD